jgi:hypothetical protein
MAKDAYWFKHDCNASNDSKILSIRHIHGWAGVGMFWGVIEILREQEGYKYPSDDRNLQLLSNRLLLDFSKFKSFFLDCITYQLLKEKNGFFYSESLNSRMKQWNTLRNNGLKGGRPITRTKPEANQDETRTKPARNHKRREEENNIYIPSEEEVINYFKENGYGIDLAKQVFKGYAVADWHDSRGKKIKNWKQKMIQVWFKEENKSKTNGSANNYNLNVAN